MDRKTLKKIIDTAAGRIKADTVIKNCRVINVYTGKIEESDIAIADGFIAGTGNYDGIKEIDAGGKFAAPGFIDSHIHIESSYLAPSELGKLTVPHGTTTIIADPHEIANVRGIKGMDYMLKDADGTDLDIKFMVPSCVPATIFETAGASIDSRDIADYMDSRNVLGLGEFMNYPGVIAGDDETLDRILAARDRGRVIDGHAPNVFDKELNAYAAANIAADHECATLEDMENRLSRGMYVMIRQGSACHNLKTMIKGVNSTNSRRCVLCSDDRQPKTIFEEGHLDNHINMCLEEGIDIVTAIQMATLNAAELFKLEDRGAIAPGKRADIVLFDMDEKIHVKDVFIEGKHCASECKYTGKDVKADISGVRNSMNVKGFSKDKLKLNLTGEYATAIELITGEVVTKKTKVKVQKDSDGDFVRNPDEDVVKIAVVERHKGTGNVACGLIKGYGIRKGAVALSIAHDSHNIIVTGVNNDEMEAAVNALIAQEGGMVLVKDGKVIESMPLPIGGLMTDKSGKWVDEKLTDMHEKAHRELGISGSVEPVMTLCFMSLPVIPEIKITDRGLFDVTKFDFIDINE